MHLARNIPATSRLPVLLTVALWAGLLAPPAILLLQHGPQAGIDGLTAAIATLTLFVAAVVATFSLRYMRADRRSGAYFATLALLVSSVLVCVAARNLLALGAAWCASGLLLARLIGHTAGWSEARAAARRTMLAFAAGDAALLAALALLGLHARSLDLAAVLSATATLPATQANAAALLLLVAAAARCALPPFSGWLLSSMTAPTPVSALMHAGLVNAGGFLLIRFGAVMEAAPAVRFAAIAVGLVAAIYGIGIMTVRPDIKRSLAGSTVSQMGFMIMSCGLGAYTAALWHIIAHGLFKAWLFLGSGSAIGMKGPKRADDKTPEMVALATVLIGLALALRGQTSAAYLPVLLGGATAVVTLLATLRAGLGLTARIAGAGLLALLIACHALGLHLAGGLLPADAPAIMPAWALLALVAGFLGLWVWQQRRRARAVPLPARLYVHLLNAGTLGAAPRGELQ